MGFSFENQRYGSIAAVVEAEKLAARKEANRVVAAEAAREKAAVARAEKIQAKRMALADKITLAIVDQISAAIIRPGPKPEERECYVMAQELRDYSPELRALVADILKIEAEEKPQGEVK